MGMLELSKRMAVPHACLSSLSPSPFSTTTTTSSASIIKSSPCSSPATITTSTRVAAAGKAKEWRHYFPLGPRKTLFVAAKAVENQGVADKAVETPGTPPPAGQAVEEETSDNKILPYCSIDKRADKRSLGELEQEFLEALQSFYYDQKPIMSNEEFDNLKEELIWEGSSVVILSADEQKFMEASLSYAAGKPNMKDAEYDALKLKLKKAGSKVAMEGPRCSLRSKKVYSDSTVDYLKMFLLNVPAALVALTLVFFLDDLTGFEITYLLELPEPYSFLFTWFVVLPVTYIIAQSITNIILKDFLILKGPCPNCGLSNTSFFGTILTIPSGGDVNVVKCEQCSSTLQFELNTRLITLESTSSDKTEGKKPKKATSSASVN